MPCRHEIVFAGSCADCGISLGGIEPQEVSSSIPDSPGEYVFSDKETEQVQQLCHDAKLSLILDLDHTLVHVTSPTFLQVSIGISCMVGGAGNRTSDDEAEEPAAQFDEEEAGIPQLIRIPMLSSNRMAENHVMYKELSEDVVYEFFLPVTMENSATRASVHWLRLRPGVLQFLRDCKDKFELYLYTHGVKTYAETVLAIIDPTYELFGNPPRIYSRECSQSLNKTLSTIFPVNHSLAVVVDDRDDVWPQDMCNLIKVSPFRYYYDAGRDKLCLEGALFRWLRAARDRTPGDQEKRPSSNEVRVALADSDMQLPILTRILMQLREATFDPTSDCFGDVRAGLTKLRSEVLRGCVVVTSGIIPRVNAKDHPVRRMLQMLGARIDEAVTLETTHLIAARPDTFKVFEARKLNERPNVERLIRIVTPSWFEHVAATWEEPPAEMFSHERLPVEHSVDGDHWYLRATDSAGNPLPWPIPT